MRRQKLALLAGFGAAVVSVGIASAAFACQILTTLIVSPGSGPVGTTVVFTGDNYRDALQTPWSDVHIRLDTRDGRILATVPRATIVGGKIEGTFTVPSDVSVGYHTILATQVNVSTGVAAPGTPGRASFQVTPGSASLTPPAQASSSTFPLGLFAEAPQVLAAAGVLALAHRGLARRRRQRSAPAA